MKKFAEIEETYLLLERKRKARRSLGISLSTSEGNCSPVKEEGAEEVASSSSHGTPENAMDTGKECDSGISGSGSSNKRKPYHFIDFENLQDEDEIPMTEERKLGLVEVLEQR